MTAAETTQKLPQLAVPCPAPPKGCGAPAGELCTSHGGTRIRRDSVHQARTAALIAANPAARLIADAARERRGMHGKHAADLLEQHGYTETADRVRSEVRARNGLLSAKQAIELLITNGGEAR